MSLRRFSTSLRFQLREYRARLLPLFMLGMLPLAFWSATFFSLPEESEPVSAEFIDSYVGDVVGRIEISEISERDTWPFDTTFMGVGWGLSAAALFSIIGSGARDRRLVLAGFRPWELLIARFAILLVIAVPISLMPVALLAGFADTSPINMWLVWLGSMFTAIVAIGVGLIVGSLLPRQLEGTILLIGLVGVELSISMTLEFRHYLPFFGPQALFTAGRFAADAVVMEHVLRSIGWTLGLTAVAVVLWTRHVRIRRWATLPAPSLSVDPSTSP